jgi:hypothetical protein
MTDQAGSQGQGPWACLDPGLHKCGLVLSDAGGTRILAAGVLPPEACWQQLQHWRQQGCLTAVVLGDGTGSGPWRQRLAGLKVALIPVKEAGSTLAARRRFWQLEPPRGWRRLLPEGLRLPPRDYDDVVAQLLLERHLGQALSREGCRWLRTPPAP